MCWAISTDQGNPEGRRGRISSSVLGPPVDTPTSTMPGRPPASPGSAPAPRPARATMRPRSSSSRPRSPAVRRTRAPAAARTLARSSAQMRSIDSEIVPSGLRTKSTAPRLSDCSVASAPSAVSEDTMTTGFGRCTMMRDRQVSPSISGMLMSRVMTSGSNRSSSASASAPLRTVLTSNPPSASNSSFRCRRISAESSAISNLIVMCRGLFRGGLGACRRRRCRLRPRLMPPA